MNPTQPSVVVRPTKKRCVQSATKRCFRGAKGDNQRLCPHIKHTTLTILSLIALLFGVEPIAQAGEPLTALPPRTIPRGESSTTRFVGSGSASRIARPISGTTGGSIVNTRLVGITKPSQHAELHAAVSGPILKVAVRTGDRVKAGDVLVLLDNRIAKTAVKIAEVEAARTGALLSAQIQLQLMEQQLQRSLIAFQRQAGSQFEVDEKKAARDQASAKVTIERETLARTKANLERAQAELDQYSILAPFDGEVVEVHQQAGSTVDRSKPVITIADRRKLTVELHLPLSEYGSVKRGSVLPVQAEAPVNRSLTAHVTAVSSYVNSASRTFRVHLEIENSDETLPAGFTVRQSGAPVTNDVASDRRTPPVGVRR